jgi:hypothetical protein
MRACINNGLAGLFARTVALGVDPSLMYEWQLHCRLHHNTTKECSSLSRPLNPNPTLDRTTA